ncbi:MAG: Ig-like domain-containing protein [Nitrososphaeraceae archaeon]
MNKSYIFAITLVVLIGIQLYQPTSAQSPSTSTTSNGASSELENASNVTNAATELENATSALTNITNSLQQASVVNSTTIVNRIFDSNLPIVFIVIIFLVLVIPLIFDMYLAYRRRTGQGTGKEGERRVQGIPGLYRSLMSFGVILLVGTVIFYLLALITLNINSTNTGVLQSLIDLLKNLGTILGTALATIIAFYFGVRGAESATEKAILAASTVAGEKEPPRVLNTSPPDGATGVPVASLVQATFSESMNNATINNETFTVKKKGETNPEKGTVSLSPDGKTGTFDAEEDFSPNTPYDATIEIGAQDLAGNALVSAKRWSFNTGTGTGTEPTAGGTKPTAGGGKDKDEDVIDD